MTHTPFEDIRLLILDVDGVLTDGTVGYTDSGEHILFFSIHDGCGIRALQKLGVTIAIISGQRSPAVTQRMKILGVEHVFMQVENKLPVFESLLKTLNISPEHTAYVGDDIPDIAVMQRVGLAIAVANATAPVKAIAHRQTQLSGGSGAVREVCDLLCSAISSLCKNK